MKILILDPEKKVSHRISKDTSGGYGTGNDFGDTPVPIFLKKTLKKVHDWPPMFALYSMSVLKKFDHHVEYHKKLPENYKDYVIQDEKFLRAEELKYLRGDSSKLRNTFGWEPKYTFEMLMDEMIGHWLGIYELNKQ